MIAPKIASSGKAEQYEISPYGADERDPKEVRVREERAFQGLPEGRRGSPMVGRFKHATLRVQGFSPRMIPGEEFEELLSEGFRPCSL